MTIPLILASKSKPRRDILFHAGICPTIRVSHVDEDAVLARAADERGITVDELPIDTKVMLLAEAKALAVYEAYLAVAKTAREATGERVTGRPLDAVTADDPAAALADDTRAETQTRDFSRVRIPRTEEPLQQALAAAGRGLTAAGVGPLILGCDSMFLLDGKAYGKPHTPLARAAQEHGITVDGLPIDTKVMLLAEAKALAVYEAYLAVAKTAREATGEHVTGRPLDAVTADDPAAALADDTRAETQTRDFSRVRIPRTEEPLQQALAAEGRGLTAAGVGPLILGCDSMFLLDGKAYGKPHTPEVARARLRRMSGATGELWTGHCLIDFATGRVSKGASKATLHFSEFSDTMINRYIATGEPLEVAGSFTLDGFGGAFIEGIEGDPSGIIGLSLPLARQLTEQLGVEWTDLWNVTRDERFEVAAPNNGGKLPPKENVRQPGDGWVECACGRKHWGTRFEVAAPNNGGKLPPKENVRQPGDGWVECACGRKHWGTNGAAGVLLARRDAQTGEVTHIVMQHRAAWSAEGGTWGIPGGAIADGENTIEGALRESFEEQTGEVTHIVMQHRAAWSAEGGTWGIPGGAIADGENTIEGALRESFEEANITPEDIEVVGSYCEDHGPWSYTTVFAFEKPGHEVHPKANDDESMEIVWVPIDEVPDRKLLTAMRTDWPSFEKRLRALAVEHKGE